MKKIVLLLLLGISILSCSDDDDNNDVSTGTNTCGQATLISAEQFENGPSDGFSFESVVLQDDCLNIVFSAGGCTGNTWEVALIDSGLVSESSPEQRSLRLSLRDDEDCEALITQELSFDISNLQIADEGELILNIVGFTESILYEY